MNGGIDRRLTPDYELISGYDLATQLTPLILEHQGDGTMTAVLMQPKDPPQKIPLGNYTLDVAFVKPRAARRGDPAPEPPTLAGAIFIQTGPDEYLRGRLRPKRRLLSEHAGASVRWTRHRGRRHICQRPLGCRAAAGRR